MIKQSLILLTLVAPLMVSAAPPPNDNNTGKSTGLVEVSAYPKVLHFNDSRNTISNDGAPLICLQANTVDWRSIQCLSANGTNAWRDAFSYTINGYSVAAYEYRLVGSSGARHLFLYFKKK